MYQHCALINKDVLDNFTETKGILNNWLYLKELDFYEHLIMCKVLCKI